MKTKPFHVTRRTESAAFILSKDVVESDFKELFLYFRVVRRMT